MSLHFFGTGRAWQLASNGSSLAGLLQPGDTIEWLIAEPETHGVRFFDESSHDDIRLALEFEAGHKQQVTNGVPEAASISNNPGEIIVLARAKVQNGINPDLIADIPFDCNEHGIQMAGVLRFRPVPFNVDQTGQIFVLRDDIPAILRGEKKAEPLVIRANAGDVVDITLSSALIDQTENDEYSKVGIHTHLVQYDVQSSDGAVAGLNYETSIRPSWELNAARDDIKEIDGQTKYAETVHYRWWCDTELGMVYFHDHSLLKSSLPHGLFGATIVEPAGSQYLDPVTHGFVYASPNADGLITSTNSKSGVGVADIRFKDPDGQQKVFREYVPIVGDAPANLRAFNLRRNDMGDERTGRIATKNRNGWPIMGPTDHPFKFDGGPETMFSSRVHGDPVTPIWRSYPGDPVRIRTEGAGTNEIHGLNVHGKRWRYEPNYSLSTYRDFGLVGISEGFTFAPDFQSNQVPGDYWYGSVGRATSMISGKWGLWRNYPSGSQVTSSKAQGDVRIYIKQENVPENFTLAAQTRFISSTGILFRNQVARINQRSVLEEFQTAEIEGEQVYFFSVYLTAEQEGEDGNLPGRTRFGIDSASAGSLPKIVRIVGEKRFLGGATPLKPIQPIQQAQTFTTINNNQRRSPAVCR